MSATGRPAILDCTLRDGGYYTNWDFSPRLVTDYVRTVSELPVTYVELGYRSPAQPSYLGEYFFLPDSTLERVAAQLQPGCQLALMLNAKDCEPEQIAPLLASSRSRVRLVRLAVDPHQLTHGVDVARAVKALGFEVALNLMYLSRYLDRAPLLDTLASLHDVVDDVYFVDSYGGCLPDQVGRYIRTAKSALPQRTGFHGHDNLELAFANTLAAIDAGVDMVDATILGMGRGAGNLRTELIVPYLASRHGIQLDFSRLANLLEAFDELKQKHQWGPHLPYIVSGLADLPQKDVMDWLAKKRHSSATIVLALQQGPGALADATHYPSLREAKSLDRFRGKPAVIIGGGQTAALHRDAICEYAKREGALVIHSSVRHVEAYASAGIDAVLCLPGEEVSKLPRERHGPWELLAAYILTAPPRVKQSIPGALRTHVFETQPIAPATPRQDPLMASDTPLGLALGASRDLGARRVFLVGFDGYAHPSEAQQELAREVEETLESFQAAHPEIVMASATPTRYAVRQVSIFALLASPPAQAVMAR